MSLCLPSFAVPDLTDIRRAFTDLSPVLLPLENRTHAAVAMVFRQGEDGPEVLFIERARHDGDPWSGDLGFPGGKVEPQDGHPRRTAQRETFEEIGLDLEGAVFLGRLNDITGAHLPVQVSCFLFQVTGPTSFTLGDEVVRTFWIPLSFLYDPARRVETLVPFRGETLARPAIDLLGPGGRVLWGITYRLVEHFLTIMRT